VLTESWILSKLQKLLANSTAIKNFVRIIGCQCPEDVLNKASVYFEFRPLLQYFLKTTQSDQIVFRERRLNQYLGLPMNLSWPRNKKGHLRHPKSWTKKFLKKFYSDDYVCRFLWMRKLVFVKYEAVIDVPKRAFFLIKATQAPFSAVQIEKAYACGRFLKTIFQYNRFRLITITTPSMVDYQDKIDKALSWQDLGVECEYSSQNTTN